MATNRVVLTADTNTRAYMQAMKIVGKDALPVAVAKTLNGTATAVTKQQIRNVKRDLITRTKFTERSMQTIKRGEYKAIGLARGKDINRLFSRAGTVSPYLWLQEEDNTVSGIDGPKPIPTLAARISKNLNKAIRKQYRLKRTQSLQPGAFGKSGYERYFAGKPKGGDRPYGLYMRQRANKQLVMLRNLEHDEVKIKGTHFHSNAVKKHGTQQFISAQFYKNMTLELKKKGVS